MQKRLFTTGWVLLVAAATLLFTACNKESYTYRYESSYGTIVMDGERYNIRTDAGNMLLIEENFAHIEVADGERVLAHFTLLDAVGENTYVVRLNIMERILTKKPLLPSALTAEEFAELGDDPVNMQNIHVAGRYANLRFEVLRDDPDIAHFINLLVDEEKTSGTNVYLTFKHNAFDDELRVRAVGRASFDLTDLVPEGEDEITVYLSWTNYQNMDRTESFTFKKPATSEEGNRVSYNRGTDLTIY